MTLTQKLTQALRLFKELNQCFTTQNHIDFTALRADILTEVAENDFEELMNTIFNN
jgi:hypothetical protein